LGALVGQLLPAQLPADAGFEIQGSTLMLIAPEHLQAAVSAALSQRAVNF
jgi:hypothetical protein